MRRGAFRRKALPHRHRRVALGIVGSSAPSSALLAALRELRPQFPVHLKRISDASGRETLYRVEVDVGHLPVEDSHEIDLWLRIKSALLAAFPSGKPGAVTAIDPSR
jgi:hypothetical protein